MTDNGAVPRIGIVFRPQLPPERLRGFVSEAETAGLDDVWLWEDCFAEGGLTAAAAALAWTTSLRLGIGLIPVPFRNPALAAMEIATVARLFPGRFVPAAGHGVTSWMDQVGALPASQLTLLREWVPAVRALLDGKTVTAGGQYVRLAGVALDWPPPAAPPLLVGARGPRTLALAGELADGVVLDAGLSPDGVRAALATAGVTPPQEVIVYLPCGAGPDARHRLEADLNPGRGSGPDRVAVGSAEEVARTIRGFAAAGATTVVLQPAGDDPRAGQTMSLAARAAAIARQAG